MILGQVQPVLFFNSLVFTDLSNRRMPPISVAVICLKTIRFHLLLLFQFWPYPQCTPPVSSGRQLSPISAQGTVTGKRNSCDGWKFTAMITSCVSDLRANRKQCFRPSPI